MSISSSAARCARVVTRLCRAALRVLAVLLLLAVALFLPAPMLGRPRFEPPERQNRVAETRRRR
jgi:hypothetical protein